MKVLIVAPGKLARVDDIENNLETLQRIVGGYIETVHPFRENIALIVNEDGKLWGLPECRTLVSRASGRIDTLVGTFIIAGMDPEDCDFCGLTTEQARALKARFDWPSVLVD